MLIFSIIAYIVLAVWYIMGTSGSRKVSMFISVLLSSCFAFFSWDVNNIGMVIYFILGIISVFLYWIADNNTNKVTKKKNRVFAGFLALVFGGTGIHKFYLNKTPLGALYLLFSWTCIPVFFGVIDAFILFAMSEQKFIEKYNSIPSVSDNKQTDKQKSNQFDFSEFLNNDKDEYVQISKKPKKERDGDNLNYTDIRLCECQATAIGTVEDFEITVRKNGQTFKFKATDGNICSSRSSKMRAAKKYEVM